MIALLALIASVVIAYRQHQLGDRQAKLAERQTDLADEQTDLARRQLALEEGRDRREQQQAEQAAADAERARQPSLAVYWEGSAGADGDSLSFKATVVNERGRIAHRVKVEVRQAGNPFAYGSPVDVPAGEKRTVPISVPRRAVDAVGGVDAFLADMTLHAEDNEGHTADWPQPSSTR